MRLKRAILFLCLGLLVLACGLGAYIVLKNRYGLHNDRWVENVVVAAIFSVPALAAAHLREKCVWRKPMLFVIALCAIGLLAVCFIEVYAARRTGLTRWPRGSLAFYAAGLSAIWAIAIPALAVVSLPILRGWARVSKVFAFLSIGVMGATASVWVFDDGYDYEYQETLSRIFMLSLMVAVVSIFGTAIVCKIYGLTQVERMMTTALDIQVTCPRCRLQQTVRAGKSRCSGCKLKFEIRIEEPRCPQCDYLLHKLTEPVCPECGRGLGSNEVIQAVPTTE